MNEEPLFLQEARNRAVLRGVDVQVILDEDRARAENPEFPTENCLFPNEIEEGLTPRALAHATACRFCATIVRVMYAEKQFAINCTDEQ